MKCSDVKMFLSQISEKSISMQIPQSDLDFLSTNGYVSRMSKGDYDQASAEVSSLEQLNQQLETERTEETKADETVSQDLKKTHSLLFHFEGKDKKQAELQKAETDKVALSKEESDIAEKESQLTDFIQKRSAFDQLVQYGSEYLSLTGYGVLMLNALNARSSRVSDMDFSEFVQEMNATDSELRGIAQRAANFVTEIRERIPFPFSDIQQG